MLVKPETVWEEVGSVIDKVVVGHRPSSRYLCESIVHYTVITLVINTCIGMGLRWISFEFSCFSWVIFVVKYILLTFKYFKLLTHKSLSFDFH